MLNFKNSNIIFGILFLASLIGTLFFHFSIAWGFIILFLYSLVLFYGSYFIQAGFYLKSICSLATDKKIIALSFDDGPLENYTPAILNILKENRVQASFFCIGNRINGKEDLVKRTQAEGHIIGNHSYSHHFWFDLFSSEKMLNDMRMMDEKTKQSIGLTPTLFRPPYGVTNPNLKKAIINGNYTSIGWSIRSMDTVITDKNKLLEKIKKSIKPGAILLLHDSSATTVSILAELIAHIKSSGYEIQRLDKMLGINAYLESNNELYSSNK